MPRIIIILSLLLLSCSAETGDSGSGWTAVKLPQISDQVIRLRVANVVNPRFKTLSDDQLQQVLNKTVVMVKQHFGINIEFMAIENTTIEKFFGYLKPNVIEARRAAIVNTSRVTDEDKRHMQEGVYRLLLTHSADRRSVVEYAKPYLLVPYEGEDFRELSRALVDTLLKRLAYWRQQTAEDGGPVIDDSPYNEWVWWDSIGYGNMPYDVVVTNQLVASAELYEMSVHSSIRGGITAGTTSYSEQGQFNTYVYATVYPMINDSEMLTILRNDEHYSSDQVTTYAAALLTHELGHMLLHLGHPFGNRYCIMSPTPLLKYREWVKDLDPSRCELNSEAEMTPGKVNIEYRADW